MPQDAIRRRAAYHPSGMTLRRKMAYQIAAMIGGLLLVSGAALWGLNGLHQDYGVALEGYQRLRQVYEAGSRLSTAQKLLRMPHRETLRVAREEVAAAAGGFEQLPPPGANWTEADVRADAAVRAGLRDLTALMSSPPADDAEAETADAWRGAINAAVGRLPPLAAGIRRTTEGRQAAAEARRRVTILAVGLLAGAVILAALVVGAMQYRGVMRPLHRLGVGVRRVAAGQFAGRVEVGGGDEFAALAADFNRMAADLDGFYHELERKVSDKSKELVRSERLASVGYLAAGVAHEINNPLGIISGYAEYALGELRGRNGTAGDGEMAKTLQVICDEAFRCKEITAKLLSLARSGDDARRPVSLAAVAEQVASMVGGLRQFRDRRVVVHAEPGEAFVVSAVEAEMKQVALNLTVNALEAVAPGGGEVRVEVRRDGEWVELAVADAGRGMTPAALERVFEPFYTDKRGVREDGSHGTGLGLAITHAIVQSHGGRIDARSDGPGKGSRFTVRLPVCDRGLSVLGPTLAPPRQVLSSRGERERPEGSRDGDRLTHPEVPRGEAASG